MLNVCNAEYTEGVFLSHLLTWIGTGVTLRTGQSLQYLAVYVCWIKQKFDLHVTSGV